MNYESLAVTLKSFDILEAYSLTIEGRARDRVICWMYRDRGNIMFKPETKVIPFFDILNDDYFGDFQLKVETSRKCTL